jgi:hypothetical protein
MQQRDGGLVDTQQSTEIEKGRQDTSHRPCPSVELCACVKSSRSTHGLVGTRTRCVRGINVAMAWNARTPDSDEIHAWNQIIHKIDQLIWLEYECHVRMIKEKTIDEVLVSCSMLWTMEATREWSLPFDCSFWITERQLSPSYMGYLRRNREHAWETKGNEYGLISTVVYFAWTRRDRLLIGIWSNWKYEEGISTIMVLWKKNSKPRSKSRKRHMVIHKWNGLITMASSYTISVEFPQITQNLGGTREPAASDPFHRIYKPNFLWELYG